VAADDSEAIAPSPGASGAEHPHGRGHAKQTPAAAAHGQETAASHKPEKAPNPSGSEPGSGKGAAAAQPQHPPHPATPPASAPAAAAEPEAQSPPGKPPK
jgi:hypothetical protein